MIDPEAFARQALAAIDASEGRRKRRKRDTTPDRIGLDLKRALLSAVEADRPGADELEGYLFQATLRADDPGATRAMCRDILDEYRAAAWSPAFREWLERGAPSDDKEETGQSVCSA